MHNNSAGENKSDTEGMEIRCQQIDFVLFSLVHHKPDVYIDIAVPYMMIDIS